jgi:outer membrane protein assembly factor BamB
VGNKLRLDVTDDGLLVALEGGQIVSIDIETGSPCAVLLEAPPGGASAAIDSYTQSAVAHGALVGPSGFGVVAVDLWSGAVRFNRELVDPESRVGPLRDVLRVVQASAAIVVGFPVRRPQEGSYRVDNVVAALEPATGRELWRRTIGEHGPGYRLEPRFNPLVSDGERVAVPEDGRLHVLSAATGEELWAAPWTPPAVPYGAGGAKLAPLVASDGSHFALASPGGINLYDARTGAFSGAVAVPGGATALVARRGFVYAAVEATPGTPAVVAIDMSRSDVRWMYKPAYSVPRLRADDELVYVLDGDRRLWGLRVDDGQAQFGVKVAGSEFAVARTREGRPRLVAPRGDLVAFDPPFGTVEPLEPFLRWEVKERDGRCQPIALSWVLGDNRVAWQRHLPKRVMSLRDCDEETLSDYRRHPRAHAGLPLFAFGVVDAGSALIEVDATGLLAFRKNDGAVLFDVEAPAAGAADLFPIDTFELRGLAGCSGLAAGDSVAPGLSVFARCGDRLIYFNGTTAWLVALKPPRVEASGRPQRLREEAADVFGAAKISSTIPLGAFSLVLVLEGTRHLD